jgi:hypothetical protein
MQKAKFNDQSKQLNELNARVEREKEVCVHACCA